MIMRISAGGSAFNRGTHAIFLGFRLPGWRVVNFGSNANNSSNTGAFYVNANNTSSNDNANIGRQLSLWGNKKFIGV